MTKSRYLKEYKSYIYNKINLYNYYLYTFLNKLYILFNC